jgi:hypothetical protein
VQVFKNSILFDKECDCLFHSGKLKRVRFKNKIRMNL